MISKYPIVILPGWLLGKDKYQSFFNFIKISGYKVYFVEFPGFGNNKLIDRPYQLIDYVKFTQKFLKKNNITKAIFIGHSFGGRVALRLLSQNPKYAQALILTGTPGYVSVSRYKLILFLMLAKSGGVLLSFPFINKTKNQVRKFYYKLIGAKDFYHTEGHMRETFKNIIKEPLVNYMKKIRLPTLILWGKEDKIVPVKIARKMQKTIINSELEIVPQEKHMFITQNPELFLNKMNIFLKKNLHE